MLIKLKTSVFPLLAVIMLATMNVNCSKKQTATTAHTSSTSTEKTATGTALPTADLQKYTGRYDIQSDDISWAEVTVENSKLYGESEGRPKTELVIEGTDKFKVEGMDATVTFTRDNQQQVTGLIISYQGNEIKGDKVK